MFVAGMRLRTSVRSGQQSRPGWWGRYWRVKPQHNHAVISTQLAWKTTCKAIAWKITLLRVESRVGEALGGQSTRRLLRACPAAATAATKIHWRCWSSKVTSKFLSPWQVVNCNKEAQTCGQKWRFSKELETAIFWIFHLVTWYGLPTSAFFSKNIIFITGCYIRRNRGNRRNTKRKILLCFRVGPLLRGIGTLWHY